MKKIKTKLNKRKNKNEVKSFTRFFNNSKTFFIGDSYLDKLDLMAETGLQPNRPDESLDLHLVIMMSKSEVLDNKVFNNIINNALEDLASLIFQKAQTEREQLQLEIKNDN